MKSFLRPALAAACLLGFPAAAGPPSTQKAMGRRAEAQSLVGQIVNGGNPQGATSRLRFLGEENFGASALGEALSRSVDDRQRRNLVFALSLLASPAAERTLIASLQDRDGAIRMSAVQGLGRMRSKAIGPIAALLLDKTLGVRREAARALGDIRNPAAAKPLLAAAKAEGEPEARAAMLVALGACGDKKQIKALEAFLDSSSESTRFAAAQGLCQLGAPKGLAFAKGLLGSEEPFQRRQALALLEGSRGKEAQALLKPLLNDSDKALAAGAARILYRAGDASKLEWLVLASFHSKNGEEKLVFEAELETLRITDEQRKAILVKAGL